MRFREAESAPPPARPDLRAWDYLGCLELAIGDWRAASDEEAARAEPPDFLMLHPDRFDAWGREYDTFRAVPLSENGPSGDAESYRWFTRADTLWVVWSDVRGRGGIALREEGRSLAGRAALAPPGASGTLDAQVNAWPVNCYTRLRERDPWLR